MSGPETKLPVETSVAVELLVLTPVLEAVLTLPAVSVLLVV